MKHLLSLIIFIFFISCSTLGIHSANAIAKLGEYRSVNNLPYSHYKNNEIDIYIPQDASYEKTAPVIVFFYGGCWGECVSYYKEDYEFVADALTSMGYIVVIPDYRMFPKVEFKTLMGDAQEAVQWTKENIELFFGDPDNIFVMGHSSGAHISVLLSLDEQYLNKSTRKALRGTIGISGPYDFLPYTENYLSKVFGPQDEAAYSQPINFVHKDQIPLLLMYGKDDTVIKEKNIINLSNKIRSVDANVSEKYYEGLDHRGILTAFTRPFRDEKLLKDIQYFINSQLK